MNENTFKHEISRARAMISVGDDPDYWVGYQRGISRQYHGEVFGTYEEHRTWLSLGNSLDRSRQRRGFGYYDGYNFR